VLMSPSKRRKKNISALWESCSLLRSLPDKEQKEKAKQLIMEALAILKTMDASAGLSFARCHGILADCAFLLHDITSWKKHSDLLREKLSSLKRPRHQIWLLEVKAKEALFYGRYLEVLELCTKRWNKLKKRYFLEENEKPESLHFSYASALLGLNNTEAKVVFQQLIDSTKCDCLKSQCLLNLARTHLLTHEFKKVREALNKIDSSYVHVTVGLEIELTIAEIQENIPGIRDVALTLYKYDSHRSKAKRILQELHKRKIGDQMLVLDSTKYGNLGRFIAHSQCPNCEIKPIHGTPGALPRLGVYVIKPIEPGEELTANYINSDSAPTLPWKQVDGTFPEMESMNFANLRGMLSKSQTNSLPVKVKDGKLYAVDSIPRSLKLFMPYDGMLRIMSRSCEFAPSRTAHEIKTIKSSINAKVED